MDCPDLTLMPTPYTLGLMEDPKTKNEPKPKDSLEPFNLFYEDLEPQPDVVKEAPAEPNPPIWSRSRKTNQPKDHSLRRF